jgi:protease I
MANELSGKTIAFLTANEGVEQIELTRPWEAVEQAGGRPVLAATEKDDVQAFHHLDKGDELEVDRVLGDAKASEYDALMLPGGVANPDRLRTDPRAVQFVKEFMLSEKPVAAICHAPWLLVEANAVAGRTLTSWPSLQTDIRNAGGDWVDKPVQEDERLITSRKPDDIRQFNEAMLRAFAGVAGTDAQVDVASEQSFPASDPPPGPSAIGGEGAARS